MNLQLYIRTLKNQRISWLLYSGIGLGFLLLYISVFPSVQQSAADYNKILQSMPKGVLEAFNITQASNTLMSFLASKHFGFVWPLMAILMLTAYSGAAVAKEIEDKTMGLLLSQPLSRLQLYFTRLFAGVTGLAIFVALTILSVWPLAQLFNYDASWNEIYKTGLLGFGFGLAVLCIGLLCSTLSNETGRVYAIMSGLLLLMYVANIVAGLESSLDKIKYASLFYYFSPGNIITTGGLDHTSMIVFATVSLATATLGALVIRRRNISV